MRLLNVHTLEFRDFQRSLPKYAVASHRWREGGEAMLGDIRDGCNIDASGYKKVKGFAEYVKTHISNSVSDCDWLWIDTCCVDQKSSAEVSEAVQSMFRWYANAEVCLAYLVDVPNAKNEQELRQSEWFQRGWTLQELLAPRIVVFLSQDWRVIGHKGGQGRTKSGFQVSNGPALETTIATITGIPEAVLYKFERSKSYSVKDRLQWIDGRETLKEEDMSYSLLGIFDVTMPVLYGETGRNARRRLLEAIQTASEYHAFESNQGPDNTTYHQYRHLRFGTWDGDSIRRNQQGRALLNACAEGQKARVFELLELRPTVNCGDANGLTALHYASLSGDVDMVQALLDAGAEVNSQSVDLGTPLCIAALQGRINVVKLLLRNNAQIHIPGRWTGTPLHCASWNGSLDIAKTLLDYGGDVSLVSQIQFEHLEHGAAIGSRIDEGLPRAFSEWHYRILECQPMVIAADRGHRALVKAFLSANYPVDSRHRMWLTSDPLQHSYMSSDEMKLRYEDCTALMRAAWKGRDAILSDMLAAGANVSIRDSAGRSALSIAVQAGQVDCVEILGSASQDLERRKRRRLF